MRHWISRPFAIACGLLALVAVLAVFQYRWLGEVSEAERERVRAHLQVCANDVRREFDREITRAFVTFQIDASRLETAPDGAVASAYRSWQAGSAAPAIIDGIYLAGVAAGQPNALKRFDLAAGTLTETAWPDRLGAWRDRSMRAAARLPGGVSMVPFDPIAGEVPALIVGVPHIRVSPEAGNRTYVADTSGPGQILIVTLDPHRLRDDLIAPLVARYFGADAASSYLLSIGPRDGASVAYTSAADGRAVPPGDADAVVSLFDLQPEDFAGLHGAAAMKQEHVAITIVRRAEAGDVSRALMPGAPGSGAWQLRVRHRRGSLEQIVARSRLGNLAISGAILGVLAAGIVLIVTYTEGRQRLARQQMEFVAAVSHELRTPLAVICSAGDNLADGVVTDARQVARYGALVGTEGRRLADMVDRVLAFAGVSAGDRPRTPPARCDLAAMVDEVVLAVRRDADARDLAVRVTGSRDLPVRADAPALRSALQNVVGNALKYSRPGGEVEIQLAATRDSAQVRVVDRGLGIDADDLPHVWQPFYRGRRAVEAQVRGSGIGLSIVRQVVGEHGGRVTIASEPDAGTAVTIELPIDRSAGPSAAVAQATA